MIDEKPIVPPDLDINITVRQKDGHTTLEYTLHSSNGRAGFQFRTISGPRLIGSPEEYRTAVFARVERLRAGVDSDGLKLAPREILRQLEGIGHDLYHELFPPEMREAYKRFRGQVETLQIISNEPWIPWELIKPYDDRDPETVVDDDFLCGRFQLTRWLSGDHNPATAIAVRKLVCVTAGQMDDAQSSLHDTAVRLRRLDWAEVGQIDGVQDLPHAAIERTALASLADQTGIVDLSPGSTSSSDLLDLLEEGGVGLLHLLAPEDLPPGQSGGSSLENGRSFSPQDLHGRLATQVKRDRPLVFFNASRTARLGWSLTGLGGWVVRWVGRTGCGAFIGPQWTVSDRMAYEFARTFYSALQAGRTFGQAARDARRRCRELDPSDPTWLAFSVYAHPNGRLLLGAEPLPLQFLEPPEEPPPVLPPVALIVKRDGILLRSLRALLGFLQRRPFAALNSTIGLLMALSSLLLLLGQQAHRGREFLLQRDALHYPTRELLATGADVLWSLPWKALGTVFLGNPVLAWSTLALLAIILCWYGFSRLRSARPFLLLSWFLITTLLLTSGSLVYSIALSGPNLDAEGRELKLTGCGQLSGNLVDRIKFETCTWLKNESSANDGRRESLNGLLLWLLTAAATGVWVGSHTSVPKSPRAYLRWTLVGVQVFVFVFLLKQLPLAHAYGKWGLKYPRVMVDEQCNAQLHQQTTTGSCLAFDVSEGATELVILLRGSCSEGGDLRFWHPECSRKQPRKGSRKREVVVRDWPGRQALDQ